MAKSRLTIRFAIGRNVGKYDASASPGSQLLGDAVSEGALDVARNESQINVPKLSKALIRVVENAYMSAVRFAATKMVGFPSPQGIENRILFARRQGPGTRENKGRSIQSYLPTGPKMVPVAVGPHDMDSGVMAPSVNWHPLSARQIKRQNLNQGARHSGKFFQDTGELRRQLLSRGRYLVRNTGIVKVQVFKETTGKFVKPVKTLKTVPLADLKIILMPNIYPSHLPGMRSGNVKDFNSNMAFERALGFSEESVAKLRGPVIPGQPDIYHRPLLQPVFTYWTLYRIPSTIQKYLLSSLVGQKGGGVEDYGTGGVTIR